MINYEKGEIPNCPECGQKFKNAFEAVEHMIEDDDEFNPSLILPGGYSLMVGSMLKSLYDNRNDPEFISEVTQSAYITLFTAEVNPDIIGETVEDIIVDDAMEGIDNELKKLLKNGE